MIYLSLFLLFSCFLFASSSNVLSVFPSTYSQYFDKLSSEFSITLSEAFMIGEENQSTYGASLWIKIIGSRLKGRLFFFEQGLQPKISYFSPSIEYSPPGLLSLSIQNKNLADLSQITIDFTPSTNWIFLAFSVSYELKTSIFYYNDLGTEIYKSKTYLWKIPLNFGSKLWFGGLVSIIARIGDVKFYNNIYNDAADWNLIYSNSCAGISCSALYPSICYSECDQWCKSESEWFLPLVQPTLNSTTSYLSIRKNRNFLVSNEIYAGVNEPTSGWSDYSVTGWVQFPGCNSQVSTFFELAYNGSFAILDFSLTASSPTNPCDTLKATIYNTNTTHFALSSVSLNSLSYIGSWFFLAATVNSGSKVLTFYTQSGVNPPSALYPLISSSVTYPYPSQPFSSAINIYIGGNDFIKCYSGNYADFRIYPGNHIGATLLQYNNNIYSPATYLDPHCMSWSSIWYCQTCENGYFIKNGLCQKCHPSCTSCTSDDTETSCLSCASGYYAQPGHPSLCFDYCPLGYTWDSSLNQCSGTKSIIVNINLENNLSGDFISHNIYVNFGINSDYYPDFDIFDPLPVNKRGIYLNNIQLQFSPQAPLQAGRLVSADFTIEMWTMTQSYGNLYKSSVIRSYIIPDQSNNDEKYDEILASEFSINFAGSLNFFVKNQFEYPHFYVVSPKFITSFDTPEWSLYSLSLSYDDLSKTTQVIVARNKDYYVSTAEYYYKELSEMSHYIGSFANSIRGFLYSFAMYNYGKSYSEILLSLGSCSSCSACPADLNYCLPTCDRKEYVDENGKCQKCLSSCSKGCSRAGTCNLCHDDLCYKCTKYEIGICNQCVEHANMKNNQCECEIGYIKQNSKCIDKCEDGYYHDFNAQLCISCQENCLKCSDGNSCTTCKDHFVYHNGICKCPDKYYLNSPNKCSKCDSSCLTCSISASNCTSCIQSQPVLYDTNKCYPCDVFEGFSSPFVIPISDFSEDLLSQLSSNCIEICGDGRNMGQSQCDDGNTNNGDGCSSNCEVETGWSCFGGSLNSSDICKDTIPPSPILLYLSENNAGYQLTLSFSETVIFGDDLSKNIKIEIDGITKFSWSISLENSMHVIALEIYENVASGTSVIVNFIDPSKIVDVNGNKMKEGYAKTKVANSFTYQSGELMETSVTTVTTFAVVGAAVGSISSGLTLGTFNIQALWGMIEMMQMQYYLIFLSAKYPDNLLSYISALSISNGSFLPNPFQKFLIKKDPFPSPPERFLEESFNTDFIMNSGQFLLVWLLILIGLLITLLLFKFFPRYAMIRWLKKSYLFSILLRTGIESFLEITLSVFLQWREISEPSQNIGYLSLVLSFITMAYLILTFALVIWQVTLKSEEELITKSHKRRFGTLYEGFKNNSKLSESFLLFQNMRRVLFAIFCVFLYEYTAIQVALTIILSFIYAISLILLRPFRSNILGNALHVSSELLYFSAHCMVVKFLDDQLSDNDRARLGCIVIAILSLSLVLHVIALFITQIVSLIQVLKHAIEFNRGLRSNAIIDENNSYAKREKNHVVVNEENCAFTKTDIAPDDGSFNMDTAGDESLMKK